MGKLFKLHCAECEYTITVREGTTRSLVDEYLTVSCDACCNIENRSYHRPNNRPVRPQTDIGWWGRKKRQKELDDRYIVESAQWSDELDKQCDEALNKPCSQCGSVVRRVHFGDPFIEPIPIDFACPACICHDCMKVALEAMID